MMLPWATLRVQNLHALGDHGRASRFAFSVEKYVEKPEIAWSIRCIWRAILSHGTDDLLKRIETDLVKKQEAKKSPLHMFGYSMYRNSSRC